MQNEMEPCRGTVLVPLLSGGLDSAIALLKMQELTKSSRIEPIFINRNQRALSDELRAVGDVCRILSLKKPYIYNTSLPWYEEKKKVDKNAFPEGRNLLLGSIAASFSAVMNPNSTNLIVFGFTKDDTDDTSPKFVERLNQVLEAAIGHNEGNQVVKIAAPLQSITKAEAIRLAATYKKSELLSITWSCYDDSSKHGGLHCGQCIACRKRASAFIEANIDDPTKYEEYRPVITGRIHWIL